ncbi:type VI secretion system baseplate subunit TssG [Noviherbaspirillum cavernae]|uniref:Type VI secretion system baseplate subunit TssG n=1 Tax=Noviherbaspirillum cavernae TaxID=2320862 RepID=A0A418X136_9BURK|nr:type VI secretion system baseplate subunit TssG [Noviherbaspirillum cavernae]RJG06135.1 type VI secretion system baseplate subunit TssG [Noviherbaspirillum cavernae]
MPATKRRIDTGLIQRLKDEPYRFEFFQAVRLLLAKYRKDSTVHDLDILGQVIRFRNSVSLAFPPSEIESLEFEWDSDDTEETEVGTIGNAHLSFKSVTLTPSFIGLIGPMGVMPRYYTQQVAERETYQRDHATRAFLDIFTSRAVALFYQAWLKCRLHLQYEADRTQRFLPMLLSLAGLGTDKAQQPIDSPGAFSSESLAYYAGPLRERPQSVQWFARVVTDYFHVKCSAKQFVGQWIEIPSHDLTRLGGANCTLGQTTFCGCRVWDRQTCVRLTIGPMSKAQFGEFLPAGTAGAKLGNLFRLMVGATFDCEVRLLLDKRDVVIASLHGDEGVHLGWNSWLSSRPIEHDAHDTAYLIKAEDAN